MKGRRGAERGLIEKQRGEKSTAAGGLGLSVSLISHGWERDRSLPGSATSARCSILAARRGGREGKRVARQGRRMTQDTNFLDLFPNSTLHSEAVDRMADGGSATRRPV